MLSESHDNTHITTADDVRQRNALVAASSAHQTGLFSSASARPVPIPADWDQTTDASAPQTGRPHTLTPTRAAARTSSQGAALSAVSLSRKRAHGVRIASVRISGIDRQTGGNPSSRDAPGENCTFLRAYSVALFGGFGHWLL